jgi:hypothetical protein
MRAAYLALESASAHLAEAARRIKKAEIYPDALVLVQLARDLVGNTTPRALAAIK